ncbi:hypothetical protein SBV1_240013 [Verrucomicrobia bacterium]|nr:hypothetical protein SBV1_240013 [Verrucomicrobiota bacterium]
MFLHRTLSGLNETLSGLNETLTPLLRHPFSPANSLLLLSEI